MEPSAPTAEPDRAAPGAASDEGNDVPPFVAKGSLRSAQRRTLTLQGFRRSYLVQPVSTGGGPFPVVIVLHAGGSTAAQAWRQTSLPTLGQSQGFIVVAPQGWKREWSGFVRGTGERSHIDDPGFLHAVLRDVIARDHGDPQAVFMVGEAEGGVMTMAYACARAQDLSAAASVAAVLPAREVSRCHPAKPVPWLAMNGLHDAWAPFAGGVAPTQRHLRAAPTWLSAEATFAFWADHAQCQPETTLELLPTSAAHDEADKRTRQGCAGGASSVLYVFRGAGHTWPGVRNSPVVRSLGGSSQTVDAGSALWRFFFQVLQRRPARVAP
jgi:polyhydroxybutyrate depolymerase